MSQKLIYSESFLEFIKNSKCKVAKFMFRLYIKSYKYNCLLLTTNEINYLTFRTDGTISYLPTGKDHLIKGDGTWQREGRQNGKPSKVIRKIFSKKALGFFKDEDFECFTNEYKANFNEGGYKLALLDNSQICRTYNDNRAEGGGSLNGSCMNGDSDYLEIYTRCSKLSILTLRDKNNFLCGRALIWARDGYRDNCKP